MAKYYDGRKQGYCPKCGDVITEYNESYVDGDEVFCYFTCGCGLCGSECYKLVYDGTSGDDATWEDFKASWDISMSA